jgi:hypothetical protein
MFGRIGAPKGNHSQAQIQDVSTSDYLSHPARWSRKHSDGAYRLKFVRIILSSDQSALGSQPFALACILPLHSSPSRPSPPPSQILSSPSSRKKRGNNPPQSSSSPHPPKMYPKQTNYSLLLKKHNAKQAENLPSPTKQLLEVRVWYRSRVHLDLFLFSPSSSPLPDFDHLLSTYAISST